MAITAPLIQREVDYLIIGAGMAGTVLQRFLRAGSTVVLDPRPGSYKIGESIIPEHFHHPVLRELVPEIRRLPSWSPKRGSLFISGGSAASFPLPPHGAEVSMHVARHELEALMHRRWETPIVREAVRGVDLERRQVTTGTTAWQVKRLILDCSGPAMVVASQCDAIDELWPVWARWAYLDITDVQNQRFIEHVRSAGLDLRRYDLPKDRVLRGPEAADWSPSETTLLTEVGEGVWTWQIPLYRETLLSVGVVSKHGPVSPEQLRELARAHAAPHFALRDRPAGPGWRDREHVRNRFARTARTPATLDYVLLADACAFADPIYSVGTGLAVNKAIELAALLNGAPWTQAVCDRWVADHHRLIGRAAAAFDTWYDGSLLQDDAAAREVQRGFLVGTAFQVGVAHHYSQQIVDAGAPVDQAGPGGRGRHVLDADAAPLVEVDALLALEPGQTLAGWTYDGARQVGRGLQHRWSREELPQLVINTSFAPEATRYFRRVGDVSLSFMNLMERPYPLDAVGIALFDALEARIAGRLYDWTALAERLAGPVDSAR